MSSKRLAFFLPNIFTGLNMACGFASMVLASRGLHYEAAMILILGAIFDSVDGRVARLTGTSSSFGEQFDSLSDAVSFGVAPAFLIFNKYLSQYGRLGAVISFVYLLCAALRLARFNSYGLQGSFVRFVFRSFTNITTKAWLRSKQKPL